MRAATITAHGMPPVLVTRDDPLPGPGAAGGWVLVAVTAAPVSPLDLLCASGTSYFGPPALPYVPGVQGVGVVREADAAAGDLVGRRVWFSTDAGMAPGDGSLAELARVPVGDVVPVPDGLPDTRAASLGLSSVAAWRVLTARASLRPGEQVLVLGAGGAVGQVAVQAARLLGARRVVAVCRPGQAADRAGRLGADAVVTLREGEGAADLAGRVRAACDGRVDVVVDPVAGIPATAAALLLAEGGRLVNLGSSAGPALSVDSAVLRSRSAAVLGYTNVSLTVHQRADALGAVFRHAADGAIAVDHEVVPLAGLPEGWAAMAAGRTVPRLVVAI